MSQENNIQEDEIDLVELAKSIWAGRKFIVKVTSVFVVLGLIIAFTSPVEYEASCKLLPEAQENDMSSSLGSLAGLAGLAGVDVASMGGSSSGSLSPALYPEIVGSLPFILEVMNDTLYFESLDSNITSVDYFTNYQKPSFFSLILKYTIGLPGVLKKSFSSNVKPVQRSSLFYQFTKEEWKIIEMFKERIRIEMLEETGIIEVTVEMPDPWAAAQLAKKIEVMVTAAVVKYKTDKLVENLEFVQNSYDEAKVRFEKDQVLFAKISDRNKNVSSATASIELKRVEQLYNLSYGIYQGLASQLEQEKIKLKEETPVFTVLEPVRIPEGKSEPNRPMVLILFGLGGLMCSLSVIIIRSVLNL